jgi:hypothetical protein
VTVAVAQARNVFHGWPEPKWQAYVAWDDRYAVPYTTGETLIARFEVWWAAKQLTRNSK